MADLGLVPVYQEQFSNLLQLKLQQQGSLLRRFTDEKAITGAKIMSPLQHLDAVKGGAPAGRYAPLNPTPNAYTRRWVSPNDWELVQMVDKFDQLKTAVDPKSSQVQSAANDAGRFVDDRIIAAATAAATIGADAGSLTTEAFATADFQIAVNFEASGSVGLTVTKLIEVKRILRKYHNNLDMEPAVAVIGSNQESDLLKQSQVASSDFNRNGGVLTDGKVTRFMGFDIVVSERLPETSSNVRGCLVFVKSGICLGMWQDVMTRISERTDLSSLPWQIYSMLSVGATRTQLGKVIQILCADTTGPDINP